MPLGPKPADDKAEDPKKKDPLKDGHVSDLFAHALGTPSPAKAEPKGEPKTEVAKAEPPKPKPASNKPHEDISTFGVVREFGSGLLNSALGVAALGDRHKTVEQILRNDNSAPGGTIGAIATNLWNVASNPVQTAKGIYHAGESAVHTAAHGTWQERTQLASGAAFNIGLLGLGGAGTASRMATRTETLAMGEKAASSTVVARSALGDFSTKAAGFERAGAEAESVASRLIPQGLKSTAAKESGFTSFLSRGLLGQEKPAMAAFMDTRSLATRFEAGTVTLPEQTVKAGADLAKGEAHIPAKSIETAKPIEGAKIVEPVKATGPDSVKGEVHVPAKPIDGKTFEPVTVHNHDTGIAGNHTNGINSTSAHPAEHVPAHVDSAQLKAADHAQSPLSEPFSGGDQVSAVSREPVTSHTKGPAAGETGQVESVKPFPEGGHAHPAGETKTAPGPVHINEASHPVNLENPLRSGNERVTAGPEVVPHNGPQVISHDQPKLPVSASSETKVVHVDHSEPVLADGKIDTGSRSVAANEVKTGSGQTLTGEAKTAHATAPVGEGNSVGAVDQARTQISRERPIQLDTPAAPKVPDAIGQGRGTYIDVRSLGNQVQREASLVGDSIRSLEPAQVELLKPLQAQIEKTLVEPSAASLRKLSGEMERAEVAAVIERNPQLKQALESFQENAKVLSRPVETSAERALVNVQEIQSSVPALKEPLQAVEAQLTKIAREEGAGTVSDLSQLRRVAGEFDVASRSLTATEPGILELKQNINNVLRTQTEQVMTDTARSMTDNIAKLNRVVASEPALAQDLGALQKIEAGLKEGKIDLPTAGKQVDEIVRRLEPKYSTLGEPQAVSIFNDIKIEARTLANAPVDVPVLTAKVGRDAASFSEGVANLGTEGKALTNLNKQIEQFVEGQPQALKAIQAEVTRPEVAAVLERNPVLKNLVGDIRENGLILERPVENSAASAVSHVDALAAKFGEEPFRAVRQNLDVIAREGATPLRIADLERAGSELERLNLPGVKGEIAAVRQSIENVVAGAERIVPTQAVIGASENLGTLARLATNEAGSVAGEVGSLAGEVGQLERLQTALKEGKLDTLPGSIAETRKLVSSLEEPRYAEFFAERPEALRALQELKNNPALKEIAENGSTMAGALSKPVAEAMPQLETLSRNIPPQLAPALRPVEDGLKALSRDYSAEGALNLNRAMQEFETSAAGQLSPVARQALSDLRTGVDRVISEGAERSAIATLEKNLQAVSSETAVVSSNTSRLSELLRETPVLSPAENKIVESLNRNVQKLESTLERPVTAATAATTAREVEQLVRELERPEFSRYFAENPRLAKALDELKSSSESLGSSVARVESQSLTVERVQAVNTFRATTETALTRTETILNSGSSEIKIAGVADDVKGFANDINALRSGAGSEASLASLRNRVENLETLGASQTARELSRTVNELENQATVVARAQRIEAGAVAVERESAAVSTQSQNLARSFSEEANLAPSRGVGPSAQAQIVDNLDFVSRQSRVLANVEADVQSVAKIKEALNRVEELSAGGKVPITGERRVMFDELKESVARLDKAAVEAQGLRVVEDGAVRIARESDKLNLLADRIEKVSVGDSVSGTLAEIRRNAGEMTGAAVETQSQAVSRIMHQLDDPAFAQSLRRSREGANLYTELKNTVSSLDDAVKLRSLEQSAAKIEGQVQRSAEAVGALRTAAGAEGDAARAFVDYENAARKFGNGAANDRLVLSEMDEHLASIKRALGDRPHQASIETNLRSLENAHESLKANVTYVDETSRQLIQNRLPQVESYFTQLAKADSSAVQREIIRQASQEVQTLRYLEQHTSLNGAGQLELAQSKLVSAANDLEVAAYRRNLLRLAAEGVKGASDKFLLAGLTSEGFKATTMARSMTSTLSNFADMVRIHARLLPVVGGENGALLRGLSANDALFANNRSLLFSPENIRYGSAAMMAASVGTLYYSSRLDSDVKVGDNRYSPAVAGVSYGNATAQLENNDVSRQAIPSQPAGHFSPVGQDVVRSAFAHDVHQRAVNPAVNQLLSVANPVSVASQIANQGNINQAKPVEVVAGQVLSKDDPNFNQKYTWLQTYGVSFAPSLKAEPLAAPAAPVVMAQSINLRPRTIVEPPKPFEKPANDRFIMPTAMTLNTPLSLLGGNQAQRSDLSVRGNFLNPGVSSQANPSVSDGVALAAGLQHEAETEAGSNGVKNMQGMEETEHGLDHAAGGGVVAQATVVDPDNDDESGVTGQAGQTTQSASLAANSRPTIPGPPRKKKPNSLV